MKMFDLSTVKAVQRAPEAAEAEGRKKRGTSRNWSPQQLAIFDWCERGQGNLVVRARAGTGKTTTIVEAAKLLPSRSVLLCAFNKRIAEELRARMAGTDVHVSTLHALGMRLWKRVAPNVTVDAMRGWRLAEEALKSLGQKPLREYKRAVKELAGHAKGMVPFAAAPDELEPLGWVFGHFDGLSPNERDFCTEAAFVAMNLALTTNDGSMDFDDMLFLPLKRRTTNGEYDFVVVDEAQDMNLAQLELAQLVMRSPKNGLIVVGDDKQAIYGFRGADSTSLDRLKKRFSADELGLTITYRCPKKVVAFANRWVPDLRAADTAEDGKLWSLSSSKLISEVQPGDFIISRLNAPLLSLCLNLAACGKRAKVEGRDVGKQLQSIIDKLKPADIEDLIPKLQNWADGQVRHAGDDDALVQSVHDIHDSIVFLARESGDLDKLRSLLDSMFEDSTPGVVAPRVALMTGHKAKGLEAERVFVLCDTFKRGFSSTIGSEEDNLRYVTATRAKKELVFVDPDWKVEDGKDKKG